MPVITGPHNNSDIFLTLGVIDADAIDVSDPTKQFGQIPTPNLFKALIDTGAQKTMISPAVVQRLNLTPRGKILVSGVGPTAHYHNGYFFHVAFIVPSFPLGQQFLQAQPFQFQQWCISIPRLFMEEKFPPLAVLLMFF
jgi:hypothetical protein